MRHTLKSRVSKPVMALDRINSSRGTPARLTTILLGALLVASAPGVFAAPTINSVYPPTLTDRVGDHVAFVVSATGTGALSYQWFQGTSPLGGQTGASLVVTNITTGSAGSYWVEVTDSTGTSSNFATLNVSTTYLPLYPSNLVVSRVGDGVQALSGGAGNTLYLDEYSSAGAYVSSIQIPDETPSGPTAAMLIAGGATSAGNDGPYEAVLASSENKEFLTFVGYSSTYPNASSDVTLTGQHIRTAYGVNTFGYYAVSYTNAGLYSGGNHTIRGVVSDTETNYWFVGQAGAGGIKCVCATNLSYASGSGLPTISTSSGPGCHVAEIIPTNSNFSVPSLVYSDWSSSGGPGIYTANGLPQPANGGSAPATALILTGSGSHPFDFAVSPDGTTIYISDDLAFTSTSAEAGGVQRWDYSNTVWTFSYTIGPGGTATNGMRGMAVDFSAHSTWGPGVDGAVIYAVTAASTTNSLVKVVDDGASSTPTVLATAGTNELLCGLRFGPSVAPPVGFLSTPVNQIVPAGSEAVFSVGTLPAAGPFTYSWYDGAHLLANGATGSGSTILGANTSSLIVSNVSVSDIGSYTVVVSNPASTNSAEAALDLAIVFSQQPVDQYVQKGANVTFNVAASGNGTLNYQWYSNGVALANVPGSVSGVTTPSLSILDVNSNDIAGYDVVVSDTFISTNTSATAYLELGTEGTGTGLIGQYWANQLETNGAAGSFQGPPTLTRIDPEIDFTYADWALGPAPGVIVNSNNFAVIWSGEVQPTYTDTYTFYTLTDDGTRLYVNGQELVEDWIKQGATQYEGQIALQAGQKYSLVMQYFNGAFPCEAELYWSSTLEPMRIVPQSALYPAAAPSFAEQPITTTNANQNGPVSFSGGSVSGVLPFTYQWYANGTLVPGQTNLTFSMSNTPLSLNGDTLTLVVSDAFGEATNQGTYLSVYGGADTITQDIASMQTLPGATVVFNVQVQGAQPTFQWTLDGTNLTDTSRISGSKSNILTIASAFPSDSGTYQLQYNNSFGSGQSTAAALAVAPQIVLNNGGGWQLQGTGFFTGNLLTLTDGGGNDLTSAWVNFPLYDAAFSASWIYEDVGAAGLTTADGFSFAVQNVSPTAIGGNGNNLGVSGLSPSWEVEFNIFPGTRGGVGIAFDTNGLTGAVLGAGGIVGNPFSSTAPVDISSGDPIGISLIYLNGVASVTLTDMVTSATFKTSETINIPAALGTTAAYIGLTGAASSTDGESTQTISNFFFTPLPTIAVQKVSTNVLVSWLAAAAPGYYLQESTNLSTANWTTIPDSFPTYTTNGLFEVLGQPTDTDLFFRLVQP